MENELQTFVESVRSLVDVDEALLTDEAMDAIMEGVNNALSPAATKQAVSQIIQNLEAQGLTREETRAAIKAIKEVITDMVYGENTYTGNKQKLIEKVLALTFGIFDAALEKYHNYAIDLPMKLEEGAKVPTYAHDSDAAADLYAMEDMILPGNSKGNKIRTGVKIELPENWLALIIPRSSIGAKTPLRLSNSVGLIDSGYRGELGVLYDNTSDKPYDIHAGDRIAQLLVMPSYRFKAQVVDSLEDTDRGTGGFGSTGT
jgi:dUTP pyrophosphatase